MWVKKGLLSYRAGITALSYAHFAREGLFVLLSLGALHDDVEHCVCDLVVLDRFQHLFTVFLDSSSVGAVRKSSSASTVSPSARASGESSVISG